MASYVVRNPVSLRRLVYIDGHKAVIYSVLLAWMVGREFPVSGLWVVGTMAGISLLFSGVTTIILAGTVRKVAGAVEKVA